MIFIFKNGLNGIDYYCIDVVFVIVLNIVQIWDEQRMVLLSIFQFGSLMEIVFGVKFNQSEISVLVSVGNDRIMCLYDI